MADTLFRVHFEDGTKLDITPPTARRPQAPGIITKIKRVKENG
ncbi:hypothetical protein ACD589_12820 [Rhizobium sp. 814_E9_N1_1]|nr:hypothetical protein [Rhizobium leguminosarum]